MKRILRSISLVILLFAVLIFVNCLWFGVLFLDLSGKDKKEEDSTSIFRNLTDDPSEPDDSSQTSDPSGATDSSGKDEPIIPLEETTREEPDDQKDDQNLPAESGSTDTLYYSQLDEQGKKAYRTLLPNVSKRKEEITIDPCPVQSLEDAWTALLCDHEEIFWTDGFHYLSNGGKAETVQPDYIYTREEIAGRQKQIDEVVRNALKGVSSSDSDYNKILFVYEYIINQTDYVAEADNNQCIDSVLLGKESVCAGYARTTKLLLDQLGVENYYVLGFDKSDPVNGGHAWNIVKCEGNYYHVDTTWGDPLYNTDKGDAPESNITYDYLNCCDDEILRTHIMEEKYSYPPCSRMDWNYYVVNGCYYDNYSRDAILESIHKDIDKGKKTSVFKYSSETEYKKAFQDINACMEEGMRYYKKKNPSHNSGCLYSYDDKTYMIEINWAGK